MCEGKAVSSAEVRSVRGAFSFAYFSLGKQRKVRRNFTASDAFPDTPPACDRQPLPAHARLFLNADAGSKLIQDGKVALKRFIAWVGDAKALHDQRIEAGLRIRMIKRKLQQRAENV